MSISSSLDLICTLYSAWHAEVVKMIIIVAHWRGSKRLKYIGATVPTSELHGRVVRSELRKTFHSNEIKLGYLLTPYRRAAQAPGNGSFSFDSKCFVLRHNDTHIHSTFTTYWSTDCLTVFHCEECLSSLFVRIR